jgi:hypothetical protein
MARAPVRDKPRGEVRQHILRRIPERRPTENSQLCVQSESLRRNSEFWLALARDEITRAIELAENHRGLRVRFASQIPLAKTTDSYGNRIIPFRK